MKKGEVHDLFATDSHPVKIAGGFVFTEGPAADSQGNVYFTDQPNNRIMKWSTDNHLSVFMHPAGRANGMSFDKDGLLLACADAKNELWAIDKQKKVTVIVDTYNGKPLNGPNDVWVHPDGFLFFTDPFYRRPYWDHSQKMQPCEGVYRVDQDRKTILLVIDDMVQPNGIVGTPDGKTLYVSDIADKKTYAYAVDEAGKLSGKRLFCSIGSDGMTIDEQGNIYLTGNGVTIVDNEGKVVDHIVINEPWTANVCFGGTDMKTLFITASRGLYSLSMQVRGIE
jgi:gluconolactonase